MLSALPQSKQWLSVYRYDFFTRMGAELGKLAMPFMQNPLGIRGYGLGLLLELLPCGLIFAALMIVSTTVNPFTAALTMAIFTVGTFPSLFFSRNR